MTYIQSIVRQKEMAIEALRNLKVDSHFLDFGGEGVASTKRIVVPQAARSEFLANRAMGDWAEERLTEGLREALAEHSVSHYGDSDRIGADDPGFRDFYVSRLEDVRVYGKRPDLLVFPKEVAADVDLTAQKTADLIDIAKRAVAAIEVRSSKYEALTFMDVKRKRNRRGRLSEKDVPSFTVKIEDLKIVYRWIEKHEVQQVYAQVFFDSVYAISVKRIFDILSSGDGFRLERPQNSQLKNTIMIPITSGTRIDNGSVVMPEFEVRTKRTELGRHDAYVVPVRGRVAIDPDAFWSVLS